MATTSNYLAYLPPVLWDRAGKPPVPGELPLGALLAVFEKILGDVDYGVPLPHGDHSHVGLERVIDRLPHLFDPDTAPADFLPYLASWLALRFPDIWDDYQRRKVTSEIVQVYRARGLKEGLDRYLDIYTVAATRPRIVVDDGSKVLFTRPAPGQTPPIHTLVSQQPLVSPTCVVRAPDGTLLVGDLGPQGAGEEAVWRLRGDGQPPFSGAPPTPQRVGPAGWNLTQPVALAVDGASPWNAYLLDRVLTPTLPALYQLPSPGLATATTVATRAGLGINWPVAMVFDPASGHLLILDRGALPGGGAPPAPFILDVTPNPFAVTSHTMTGTLIQPVSMALLPGGDLLVGDAREQEQPTGNPPGTPLPPGNLVRVTRGATWTGTTLLSTAPGGPNPLVAPAALAHGDAGEVYVADIGLKPLQSPGSPYLREVAEPATVYRVTLGAPAAATRAARTRQLVSPTGMVYDGGTLYLTDRGEYADAAIVGIHRDWRSLPHEFGVVIHFSLQRPTTPQQRKRIAQDVREIVGAQAPAHTEWTLVYGI